MAKLLIPLILNFVLLIAQNVECIATETSKTQSESQNRTNTDSYVTDLQKRLDQTWLLPPGCPLKKVAVVFKIEKDGQVSHTRIGTSSGRAILDNAAIKAVQNASPLAVPPAQYGDTIDIVATFDSSPATGGKEVSIRLIPQPRLQ